MNVAVSVVLGGYRLRRSAGFLFFIFGFDLRGFLEAIMARERPQLREESIASLLKQSWFLWRSCLVPVLILALISSLYSYALETYVSPMALSHMDGNGNSTQSRNSSSSSLAGLAGARDAQDLKMARELFEGGGGQIEDKDKGFVARFMAAFLASFDEALMEGLADSREKKMSVYDYDSRGGTESSRKAALNLESSSHPNYDVDVSVSQPNLSSLDFFHTHTAA